ncbi:MAG: hypothetical protein ACQERC_04155 [Bacteroidota bacterium]
MKPFAIAEYQQTYLTDERLEELYGKKRFKLFVPAIYGGLELSLREGLQELIRVAEIQGGLGWTVNLGAGANWFSGFFHHEAAKEIFTPEKAVIAGSGFASGSWKRAAQDRYVINGTWSRCTGAKHASYFSLNAGNAEGMLKTFVVPRNQVQLADEKWPIFGLRNTSSYAIDIRDQSIPSGYEFQINAVQNPYAYLVHQVPFETFARLCMSASFIGIIECFLEKCRQHPLNATSLQVIEEQFEPLVEEAKQSSLDWSEKISEAVVSDNMTDEVAQQMQSDLGNNNLKLYELTQQLFFRAGLPIVEEDTLVHWAYRDVLTAVQHYMVKP